MKKGINAVILETEYYRTLDHAIAILRLFAKKEVVHAILPEINLPSRHSSARAIFSSSSVFSNGFRTKSDAPSW